MFDYRNFLLISSFGEGSGSVEPKLPEAPKSPSDTPDKPSEAVVLTQEQLNRLTPEQRANYERITKDIAEKEKELVTVEASLNVVSARQDILKQKADTKITPEELPEAGAKDQYDTLIRLRGEIGELTEQRDNLVRAIELTKYNHLNPDEIKKLQNIKPEEFLNYSPQERLRFITKGNVKSDDIKEGGVTSVEFTFTFDAQFNRKLHQRTTAGQTLPENVRFVESEGVEYQRRGTSGEFFAPNGHRLIINEGTVVNIKKYATPDELKALHTVSEEAVKQYKDDPNYDFILAASQKGMDPKFLQMILGPKASTLRGQMISRGVEIEDLLTDLSHLQDAFKEDFPSEETFKDGKVCEKFAGYVMNEMKTGYSKEVAKEYGFNEQSLISTRRSNNPSLGGGPMRMEDIAIDGVSKEEVDIILKKKEFRPGSKEAQVLYRAAAQAAGLPPEWGTGESIHRILAHESNGIVGRLNYTIKGYNPESFKAQALSSTRDNPIGAKSTASGLGQLLLSNVDKYYPDGRSGIGDALNEAVGMLRYVKDRYGSPDIAWSVYGKIGDYDHPTKGRQHKGFKEGY